MGLLRYDMECTHEECGKTYIVIVDEDETIEPTTCPFCGETSVEIESEEDED